MPLTPTLLLRRICRGCTSAQAPSWSVISSSSGARTRVLSAIPRGSPPHTQIGSQPISVSMPGPGPGVGSGPKVGAGSGIGYYNSPPVSQGQRMFPRQVNGNANGQQQQQHQHPLPMPPIHNQGLPPQTGQYNHVGQVGQNGQIGQNGQRTLPTKASFGGFRRKDKRRRMCITLYLVRLWEQQGCWRCSMEIGKVNDRRVK